MNQVKQAEEFVCKIISNNLNMIKKLYRPQDVSTIDFTGIDNPENWVADMNYEQEDENVVEQDIEPGHWDLTGVVLEDGTKINIKESDIKTCYHINFVPQEDAWKWITYVLNDGRFVLSSYAGD